MTLTCKAGNYAAGKEAEAWCCQLKPLGGKAGRTHPPSASVDQVGVK